MYDSDAGILHAADSEIAKAIDLEYARQTDNIELIASENFASPAVMLAQGSVLTNKYAEGYKGKRYYGGCEYVDIVEHLAIERVKKLFNCSYANVQPHSGSQANQAVFLSLLNPGDKVLAMSLNSGGHLTHGATPNMSGKWFDFVHYDVDPKTYTIDYNIIEELSIKHKPKLIIAGFSAYSRSLDFKIFNAIASKVGAYLMVDMAHIAGLIATGAHESPFDYVDVVTSTTHKTLRGPRGGLILTNNEEIAKKINFAVFPGLQGGPLMHVIAAKAVAFKEALEPEYKSYINQVVLNAKVLASTLQDLGYDILTNGTDNHMVLVDLRKNKITGKVASEVLDRAGITCNKNAIPFDVTSPFITSGIRLGTPACTTRGFKENEFIKIAQMIHELLRNIISIENGQGGNSTLEGDIKKQVLLLTKQFPLY